MVIGSLIIAAMVVVGTLVLIGQRRQMLLRPQLLATVVVVLVCAAILTLSFGVERSLVRWNQTLDTLFASEGGALWEGRVGIYRVCWLSLQAAGWFGFGPGTFAIVFPYLRMEHGSAVNGVLRYAHQDYLQTALEWGRLGFLLWGVLVGGGNRSRDSLPLEGPTGDHPRAWNVDCALHAVAHRSPHTQPGRFSASDRFAAIDLRRPSGTALGEVP